MGYSLQLPLLAVSERPTANELPTAPTISFPADSAVESTETSAAPDLPGVAQAPMTAAGHEAERLRGRFPSLLRFENSPMVADVSLLPKPPVRADDEVAETANARVARRPASRSDQAMARCHDRAVVFAY